MVRSGGVDQGGPGNRPARRRVDDPRLPAPVRPALVGHQPLLPTTSGPSTTSTPAAPSTTTRRTASSTRASSGRASGACAAARSSAARRSSARCSSTPAAGSGRSGTSPTPTCSTATPAGASRGRTSGTARWWSPITNAEHLHLREHVGMVDLTPFNEFELDGSRCRRLPPADVRQQRRRRRRPLGVHAAAHAGRRVPRRPDDHAPRRRALPRRHRRLRRRARPLLVPPPPARRRFGDVHRPHVGVVHDRRVGTEGGGDDDADRHRLVATRWPSTRTAFPYGSVRDVLIDGVPCTMFRISYVGESGWEVYTNTEHGPARVGHHPGGRRAARHPPDRDRRLRRHRAHREGLPADGRRAGERVRPGRGRAGPAEGEGRRLHRQGAVPGRAASASRRRSCARWR